MSNAVDKEVDDLEIDDSEKTEKQDKGETEEREEGDETLEQEEGEGETLEQEDDGDETLEQEDDGDEKTLEQEEDGETLEREDDGDETLEQEEGETVEQDDDGEHEDGNDEEQEDGNDEEQEDEELEEDNEHLLKNCLMATIRIPIRIDKDGSFDMINHYGEIKIEEMSDIPIKSSDSLYTKLLAYIRENPEYLAKIMKDMELKGEDEQQEQEEYVTEITPDLFDFSNQKTREKPLNTSFRSKTIKSKNFTKKNYKSDYK